jgi:hypothetical protein
MRLTISSKPIFGQLIASAITEFPLLVLSGPTKQHKLRGRLKSSDSSRPDPNVRVSSGQAAGKKQKRQQVTTMLRGFRQHDTSRIDPALNVPSKAIVAAPRNRIADHRERDRLATL